MRDRHPHFQFGVAAIIMLVALVSAMFFAKSPTRVRAQNTEASVSPRATAAAPAVTNNAPPTAASAVSTNAPNPTPGTGTTNAPPQSANVGVTAGGAAASGAAMAQPAPGGAPPAGAAPGASGGAPPEDRDPVTGDISLSLQGANVDTVVQWLARTTGKSVVKHPKVQCQVTIVSSKKLPPREAVNLVYRALALEGFTTIESSKSILITPEGQEPKTSPELIDAGANTLPEGRQRLIKIFHLDHVSPGEIKDKIKAVLTEKASVETDERSSNLIITDYTENVRLAGELIKELDSGSSGDTTIEIIPLKYAEADELASLLTLILNAQGPAGGAAMPGQPMPGQPMPGQPMPGQPGRPPGMPGGPPGAPGQPPGAPAAAGAQVRFWPDKTANRLIVSAPKSKMAEVHKLLNILDTEKPQDVSVRVIPLRNVTAEDLVKEIGPLYQKLSGKSVKETIEVTASSRANSLIVLSSEANFKGIQELVAALDNEDAQEKVMRAFPLKNADAEDVAKQLKDLGQEQDTGRYPYYIFSYGGSSGKNSKKMSVVADRRRNTVVVQAPPGSMEGIAEMIKTLDEPVTDNSLAPRIFALKYVSAVDLEDVLNELFLKKNQQRNYYYWDDFPQETTDRNVGRLYGKVRITSEPYSNSLIVTSNSSEHMAAVEEVIKQLDVPSQAGDTTLRINLKFAEAVTVATSVNILFAKGGSPQLRQNPQPGQPGDPRANQQQQNSSTGGGFELKKEIQEEAYYPWLGGQPETYRSSDGRNTVRPVSDLVGRVRVVPDRRSNSLLITANMHLLPQVLKLVNDLDAPTAQVIIEAKIVEVASDFRDRLGVRWSPDGSRTFDPEDYDNSIIARNRASYRDVFAGTAMADSLHSGVLDSSINLDFLIQFLRKNAGSKVLAEPQINIADNELGRLFVGAQVPFIERSLSTDVGGLNQTFSYRDVGVILEVTPHINNTDEVALKIRAESSNIRNGETLFGGAILDTRTFQTDLQVKSGQTIVLGGIIQREQAKTIRKVPLLGDIPGLGWAFKKKDTVQREVELMVFLRPKVTRSPEDAQRLLEEVERKAPRVRDWSTQPSSGKEP